MTSIDNFVFDKYTDVLINRNKYSESELSDFYTELDTVMKQYSSDKSPGTFLVLAVMINFDKNIGENINKINMSEKVITDFASWYNINYKGNYMSVIDHITNGFRNYMMMRRGNIRTYMPKEIFKYNFKYSRQAFILNRILYSAAISVMIIACCYYFDYQKINNFNEMFTTYPLVTNFITATKNMFSVMTHNITTEKLYNRFVHCPDIDYPFYLYDRFCHNITH